MNLHHISSPSAFTESARRVTCLTGPRKFSQNRGITLIELLIVLVILCGIGGLTLTIVGEGAKVTGGDGVSRTDNEVVTLGTMRTVQQALVGASLSEPGYYQDVGNFRDPSNAEAPNADDLGCLIDQTISGEPDYNPATKRGWNGPYLTDSAVRYDGTFPIGDGFASSDPNGFDGFSNGDLLILDGWGSPLVLGHQNSSDFYWLVSAGENRNLETDLTDADHDTNNDNNLERGDDIVLFLLTSDPNL
ncbi:MAG: type II secretion system protein [Verrucomicrobiota bacterium]